MKLKSLPLPPMSTLFKYQKHLFALVFLITTVQAYFMSQLEYDYNVEQLFPKNDPELQFNQTVKKTFEHHQDYLILGIEHTNGIFNDDFLPRLDSLVKKLEQHKLVKYINAPTNLRYYFKTPFGIKDLPFLHPHDIGRYEQDSIFLHSYIDVVPKFISTKNTAICSYLFLNEALTQDTKDEMRSFIAKNVANIGFDKYYLYGDIYAKDAYIKELETEMYWLSGLSLLIVLSILFFTYQSFFGVLVPIVIVILTTVWTLGTFAIFGVTINMMTVLIPTIVSIISLSDVIHIMSRYKEMLLSDKQQAIRLTFKDMRIAILLTSFTTGIGFITLVYSNIQPITELGVFTTIGVAYAYLLAIFLLPLLLNLVPFVNKNKEDSGLSKLIPKAYQFVSTQPKTILFFTLLIVLLSVAGISKLKIDSYLYEELSSKDAFSETLHFFENHFSGIRTFDLHLEVIDSTKSILNMASLQQIERLENYLLTAYGLNDVYTINTLVKRTNRLIKGGRADAFVLPKKEAFLKYITDQVIDNSEKIGLQSILSKDERQTRITGKIQDLGSDAIRKKNNQLMHFIHSELDDSILKIRLTGSTLLLDKSNEIITYKILYGLLFAVLLVSILMGLLYRSFKMTLIAIIPNILPLVMILGVIGWVGLGLKMSTVIIFTIAFGIAVDDTIHFMNRLKNELKNGYSMQEAIRQTYLSTGRAIVTTSIILVLGFGVLLFSSFQTTFITGLLVSLALLFALFADLVLLPVLLLYTSACDD